MSPAMDQHTRQYLIDAGTITRRGLTRRPQHRQCPLGCGQTLLAAQDAGIEIWCDRLPITALGEAAAVLTGRATYTRVCGELDHRTPDRITFRTADAEDVYAEHRCGMPQPAVNQARVTKHTRPDYTQAPPF